MALTHVIVDIYYTIRLHTYIKCNGSTMFALIQELRYDPSPTTEPASSHILLAGRVTSRTPGRIQRVLDQLAATMPTANKLPN